MTAQGARQDRVWREGEPVEAYHPNVKRGFEPGTVVGQTDLYVRVMLDRDDIDIVTYHLNVRDPVSLI